MHAPVRGARATVFGRLIDEPLVHFLLIGLLLFALYGLVGRGSADHKIRVDDNVAAALYAQFSKTRQRPPTAQEMNGLVESYVRDEIFYREGVEIGLDRDDPTIKRRVSQKFATIAEESDPANPPSDAVLERWMKAHSIRYAEPSLVSFDQIVFEPGRSAASEDAALDAARKALGTGVDPRTLGDGRMLLPHFELYPVDLVQREFGADFARSILTVRRGEWEGPVKSGYGMHLVRVQAVVPGRAPRLAEVRAAVSRDYEQDRRTRSIEAAYRKLREKYRVEYSAWKPAQ